MYVANLAEGGEEENPYLERVRAFAEKEGSPVVALCAALEAELAQLDPEDQAEYLRELGLTEPGLDRVIAAAYELLGLQTFYTAGPQETRAWTVERGAKCLRRRRRNSYRFSEGFYSRRSDRLRAVHCASW